MKIDYKKQKEVEEYLENDIIGRGCYVTKDGKLEHWTSYPHGSGTTTEMGDASEIQITASKFLKLLKEDNIKKENQIENDRAKKLAEIIKKEKKDAVKGGGIALTEDKLALKLLRNCDFKNTFEFRD